MTVTEDNTVAVAAGEPVDVGGNATSAAVPDAAIDELLAAAKADGLDLFGEGGVIPQLTARLLERAVSEELTDHLGYERGDPAGRGTGNSRNGTAPAKTVRTEVGPVSVNLARDRAGTFEPKILPKGATSLGKFNDNIVALYAAGMTTRDIKKAIKRLYGVDVSPDLVSRVTDGVVEELREWQQRPLCERSLRSVVCAH